jgi:hypothetical protein
MRVSWNPSIVKGEIMRLSGLSVKNIISLQSPYGQYSRYTIDPAKRLLVL